MSKKAEPGDWIVFVLREQSVSRGPLGGPWSYARVNGVNRASYSVEGIDLKTGIAHRWVYFPAVSKAVLSRGEAMMFSTMLNEIEASYIAEKKSLKPRFLDRIRAALDDGENK